MFKLELSLSLVGMCATRLCARPACGLRYQAYMVEVSNSCKSVLARILYTTVNTL